MEDRIRRLCSQLLAAKGDEESGAILIELREALHKHIEHLRERLAHTHSSWNGAPEPTFYS
ncbi:MAG TPA: hypothetical protein VNO32_12495 [Candidatus Acidoferrum sp.]|nr:hypothetical protein [Candidatus Acidoferrum sp.]